jgi:adenine-specific DNA-methyltransferase
MNDIGSQGIITEFLKSYSFTKNFIQEDIIETNPLTSFNVLIKGENLKVLEILEAELSNKIDIIYLDPVYNNKNTKLIYSNGPISHSKWIDELGERIGIAVRLLNKKDGLLVISIDDSEFHRVRLLLEKYFRENEIKTIVVKVAEPTGNKMSHVKERGAIAKLKEYLILAKYNGIKDMNLEKIVKSQWDNNYSVIIENVSKSEIALLKSIVKNKNRTSEDIAIADRICAKFYTKSLNKKLMEINISTDEDRNQWRVENSWRIVRTCSTNDYIKVISDTKKEMDKNKFFTIISPKNEMYIIKADYNTQAKEPRIKILFADDNLCKHLGDIWDDIKTAGLGREGGINFKNGKKPLKLLKRIASLTNRKDLVVLDAFAGSGGLGQAILELNNSDKGIRSFILIEKDKDICEQATFVRVKNSIYGRDGCIKTSGNLIYCKVIDE